ncbi:MAG: glycosyltransferase family 39 protein, partial [Candidatus Aureabacteria bacterium]|nr:glycosyltransferase family 39 protein [Candidatus Auribacterota bacterium]
MSTGKAVLFLILISLIIRLPLCFQPPEVIIPKVVSDDMFYYLTIARNIAMGHGATAGGGNVTNGFHPLWALILVPVAGVAGDRGCFPQAALALLTIFSAASAWFIFKIVKRLADEGPAITAAVAWLACPYTVLVALSGVEAPLFVLLLGATAHGYLRLREGDDESIFRWARLGVLAGLTVLARIDGALLVLCMVADMLWVRRREGRGAWLGVAAMSCVCAVVTAPWFLWSYVRTGFLFQMSGKAIHHQQHVLFWANARQLDAGQYIVAWIDQVLGNMCGAFNVITLLSGVGPRGGVALLIAATMAVVYAFLARRQVVREWRRATAPGLFIFAYGFIAFFLYAAYLWYSQDWYYYSIVFAACIAGGCVLRLFERLWCAGWPASARRWGWVILCVAFVAIGSHRTAALWQRGLRGWQIDAYRAALWARANLPPDAVIGSF